MFLLARFTPYREIWHVHNIRWLVLARFLANVLFYSTVIVQYQVSRGLNFTEMFLLESIISVFAFLFEVPTGVWADKFGYKRILLLGYALSLVSTAIFALTGGFWWFASGSVLFGITLACFSGCESAFVYESLPAERREAVGTTAFSLLGAANKAGFLFGLSTGSFLGAYDPALAVAATLIPLGLALLAILRLKPVALAYPVESTETTIRVQSGARFFVQSALQLLRKEPKLVGLGILESAAFALTNAIFWYNQPFFERVGIPIAWYGPITATSVGLGMLVVLTTPALQRRMGTAGTLALSCILPGLGYVAIMTTTSPLLTIALVALVIVGPVWRQPIINDAQNRTIKGDARATILSMISFIGSLAGITLNPLIGWVGDLGLSVVGISIGGFLILLGLAAKMLLR